MKKIICVLFFATLGICAAFAQKSYNAGQQTVRDKILSFLKEEGYQPSIDSDGDIKFKRQGDIYFISVSDNDSSPYYVRLSKYFSYSDRISKTKISLYAEEVNKYKMIKLQANDSNFWLDAQMFVSNATTFTSVFNRILSAMDAAEEEFK